MAFLVATELVAIVRVTQADFLTAVNFPSNPSGALGRASTSVQGWDFSTTEDLQVTYLGWYDFGNNGLINNHEVGIFDASGTLLVSGIVPSGSASLLQNGFRYIPVPETLLSSGQTYVIGGYIPNDYSDQIRASETDATFNSISLVNARSEWVSTGLVFPRNAFTSKAPGIFGPNFGFVPVPEPSTFALLATGTIGLVTYAWRRRASRRAAKPTASDQAQDEAPAILSFPSYISQANATRRAA